MANEVPEHIKKFNKMHRKATAFASAIERHGRQAYDYATGEHLRTEDGGIDLEKLEDEAFQEKVAKSMSDFYVKKAKQQFKSEIPDDDEFKKSLLVKAYGQVSYTELKNIIGQTGKNFSFDIYANNIKKMQDGVGAQLKGISLGHFKEEHIEDILKYTKADAFIDKTKVSLEDAKELLGMYKKQGALSAEGSRHAPYRKKEYYKELDAA